MKRVLLLLITFVFCSAALSAQLGINVGYQFKEIVGDGKFLNYDLKFKPWKFSGFTVGVFYDSKSTELVRLRPAINYEFGVCHLRFSGTTQQGIPYTQDDTYYDHTLSVPLRFKADLFSSNGWKLMVLAGPTVEVGLAMPGKIKITALGVQDEQSVLDLYAKEPGLAPYPFFSRFNILLGAGIGVSYNHFELSAISDWGLVDMYGSSDLNREYARLSLYFRKPVSVRLAYIF